MGWRVFPCLIGRKTPATEHGVLEATTDHEKIDAWWAAVPYLIGVATGPESGIFVVDVDTRNGGAWTSPVPTLTARSGGRYEGFEPGTHYYYKWPQGVAKMRRDLVKGVDIQGAGKYVIAPPSVTQAAYEWLQPVEPLADAPLELLAEVAVAEGATSERPGDRFNRERTWPEILEPHGYKIWAVDGSVTGWTRPGKDEGISVTTNYADSDLLWSFSTSTAFETERGYDKFGAWAVLEFGGDINAAASALAVETPRLSATYDPSSPPASVVAPPAPAPSPGPGASFRVDDAEPYVCPVGSDHLLAQYVTYGGLVTDAAPEYHEAACLSILGVLTAGMRIALAHTPEGLGTNLYLCLVGPSSIARKSTVQNNAKWFLARLRPNALLPDRSSGEKLIAELSQRHVATWMPDEMGLAVAEIYQRGGFLQAIEALLLTLYSGQNYRYATISGDETNITDLDLSVFGAGTPESWASAGSKAIASGLLPRIGVVYPAAFPPSRQPVDRTEYHEQWATAIHSRFRQILETCLAPGGERVIRLDAGAFAALGTADAEFGVQPITSRLVTAAYKITGLLALADGRLVAGSSDAVAALAITRRWAAGALRLRRYLGRNAGDDALMEQVSHAREMLRGLPGILGTDGRIVISERVIARRLNLPASTIKRIRDTMEITGEVVATNEGDWHVAL